MGEQVAVGFGNNVDYEVDWAPHVLEKIVKELDVSMDEISSSRPIESVRDLVISILGFVMKGSGGERRVEEPKPIQELAERFSYRPTLGGTSVRAAIAMRKLGVTSAMHLVTTNDHVRKLIPEDSPWVSSNDRDSIYPHLIIQFSEGSRIRVGESAIVAPRANRLIYVHDPDNDRMTINRQFADLVSDARVLLVAGFNAMKSSEALADRLRAVRSIISCLPPDASVFYEDACFHDRKLSKQALRTLADLVTVHSLNEDELHDYLGRDIDLRSAHDVKAALHQVYALAPTPAIVVHTRDWALAFGENAAIYKPALRSGVTMAATRLRLGDAFEVTDYEATKELPQMEHSVEFSLTLEEFSGGLVSCVPSYRVDKKDVTTIGLGDAFVGGFLSKLIEV